MKHCRIFQNHTFGNKKCFHSIPPVKVAAGGDDVYHKKKDEYSTGLPFIAIVMKYHCYELPYSSSDFLDLQRGMQEVFSVFYPDDGELMNTVKIIITWSICPHEFFYNVNSGLYQFDDSLIPLTGSFFLS
jgi:hypothetical protein